MLKRQFSLLAIVTLLLSPTLVHADEIGESTNISVGKIQIQTDGSGVTKIQTPNVNMTTAQPFANRWLISSRKRRIRTPVRKPVVKSGQMISAPVVKSQAPIAQPTIAQPTVAQPTVAQPPSDSTNRSVVQQTSTIRSSSHTSNNGSHSEQQSSVECSSSGSGTSVTRSTQTINGRTVSAEVRTNCP
jgi:hypothetical protein